MSFEYAERLSLWKLRALEIEADKIIKKMEKKD